MQPWWVEKTLFKNTFKNPTDPKLLNGMYNRNSYCSFYCIFDYNYIFVLFYRELINNF